MTKQTIEGKRTKVALLGCAMETLPLAPFDDPSWEIWSSGQWGKTVSRWDMWFELHDIEELPDTFKFHLAWMIQQTKPIYVARPTQWAPNGTVFQREEIEKKYGKEFLTSTIAWMFAKAIEDGYKEVGLWGVEMASDAEYFYQRGGVKHFQYIAEKYHGIKVTIPAISLLSVEKETYPFCQESSFTKWLISKDTKVRGDLARLSVEHNDASLKIAEHKGAVEALAMVKRQVNWPD